MLQISPPEMLLSIQLSPFGPLNLTMLLARSNGLARRTSPKRSTGEPACEDYSDYLFVRPTVEQLLWTRVACMSLRNRRFGRHLASTMM